MSAHKSSGKLYIVATPIGNLGDMSARAIEVLSEVDLILAEDTRHSAKLLQHFGIHTPCQAFHEHNESERANAVCQQILRGQSIALISDAGVPLISDPGFPLVKLAQEEEIDVVPIPGPCAAITALSVSGLPIARFCFEGFLPHRSSARLSVLTELLTETRTLVFYESPHRIQECLRDMVKVFGPDRPVVLARELTKLHETIRKTTLNSLLQFVSDDENQRRGECVLVVEGAENQQSEELTLTLDELLKSLLAELPLKQAVNLAVTLSKMKRNDIYDRALELKAQLPSQ